MFNRTYELFKLLACVAFICTALMTTSQVLAASHQPIVIKFVHATAVNTPKGQGALLIQKLVKKRLGGRVKVEVYPNSSLYNATQGLKALQVGDVQMMAPSMSKLGEYSKSVQLFDLPFLFDNINSLTRFETSNAGQKILHSMQKHGILGLAYWHNGMRQISANTPVVEPSDARGLKLRVEPSNVLASQIKELHAIPRKLAATEVYQAMQTGVIDGQGGNTWSNIDKLKWSEVQSDITETNNGVLDYALITNAKFWNSLPDDVRSQLSDILAQVTKSVNGNAQQLNQDAQKAILKAGGTKIHHLRKAQLADWHKAMQPVFDEYRDEIGADLIKAAQQANQSGSAKGSEPSQ